MASGRAGESLIRDEVEVERMLRAGARFGLFEVDQGDDPRPSRTASEQAPPTRPGRSRALRMHRIVQEALQAEMARDGTLLTRKAHLLRGLAGFAPTGVDTHPEREDDLAELHRHLDELDIANLDFDGMSSVLGDAGKPGTGGWEVRRWIVSQIRYLYLEHGTEPSDPGRVTASLAGEIDRAWIARFGHADELRCRLAVQLANLLRALGETERAMDLDVAVVAEQRRSLGLQHPRTLLTARSLAGDYRVRGDFDAALAENEATWLGFNEVFGGDHQDTLRAAFNLAYDRYLAGDPHGALDLLEGSQQNLVRVLGEDHEVVWMSNRMLATYLGELGRYQEAFAYLDVNRDRIKRLHEQHEHNEELRTARVRLVFERRAGAPGPDRVRRFAALLAQFQRRAGARDASTRTCKLSYAVELHSRGQSARAIELGTECLRSAAEQFGEHHPYAGAYMVNLLMFRRGTGADHLLDEGAATLSDLTARLDEGHPWVLAAAVNHAAALADAHQIDEALSVLEPAHAHALDALGDRHPTTRIAAANLELAARGRVGAWQQIDIHLP